MDAAQRGNSHHQYQSEDLIDISTGEEQQQHTEHEVHTTPVDRNVGLRMVLGLNC